MKFRTTILQMGNNTGIEVPQEIIDGLGGGKKPAVVITIGSFSYRSTVGVMGGKSLIPLSSDRRAESGLKGGDAIAVDLELDTTPRTVTVPDDFGVAMAGDAVAQAFFDRLSYSQQLKHVLSITDAKTPETRQKRLDKALDMLRAGQK